MHPEKAQKVRTNPNFADLSELLVETKRIELSTLRMLSQLSYAPKYEIVVGIELNQPLSQLSYAPMSSYVNIHQNAEFVKSNINANEKFCENCRLNARPRG